MNSSWFVADIRLIIQRSRVSRPRNNLFNDLRPPDGWPFSFLSVRKTFRRADRVHEESSRAFPLGRLFEIQALRRAGVPLKL